MKVELDPKYEAQLRAIAERSGRTVDQVIADLIECGLAGADDTPPHDWKAALTAVLKEIRELHVESADDGFSGADHDEVLYPRTP
jgi:hypothetical protein